MTPIQSLLIDGTFWVNVMNAASPVGDIQRGGPRRRFDRTLPFGSETMYIRYDYGVTANGQIFSSLTAVDFVVRGKFRVRIKFIKWAGHTGSDKCLRIYHGPTHIHVCKGLAWRKFNLAGQTSEEEAEAILTLLRLIVG